jgi:hypothetical protein
MSYYPLEDQLRARKTPITGVVEQDFKKEHTVFGGAPCEWSAEQGATHTLYCGETEGRFGTPGRGTRPAILKKTVLYVGVDEDENGKVVWEKWNVRTRYTFANAA